MDISGGQFTQSLMCMDNSKLCILRKISFLNSSIYLATDLKKTITQIQFIPPHVGFSEIVTSRWMWIATKEQGFPLNRLTLGCES